VVIIQSNPRFRIQRRAGDMEAKDREKLTEEVFELALSNEMNYGG
jgi:hypothetical protein